MFTRHCLYFVKMIIFAYLFIITTHSCHSQILGSTAYTMRSLNNTLCSEDRILSYNGSATLYRTTVLWNGHININRDFLIDKMTIVMQKCGEGFYPCEYFATLKLLDRDIKQFATSEHQMWSPIWKSVQPKFKLPLLQKGIYKMTNSTVDPTAMLATIPELAQHTWKIRTVLTEKNSPSVICVLNQFHIFKYTIHPRTGRKKNIDA